MIIFSVEPGVESFPDFENLKGKNTAERNFFGFPFMVGDCKFIPKTRLYNYVLAE